MKKKILMILFICIFILTGCNKKEDELLPTELSKDIDIDEKGAKLVCTADYDYNDLHYVTGAKYAVFGDKDNKVTKIISREITKSKDKSILNNAETLYQENIDKIESYGGYTYNINKDKDSITVDVTIDYTDFNIKKYKEDNKSDLSDEPTIDEIYKSYVSLGVKCEKK